MLSRRERAFTSLITFIVGGGSWLAQQMPLCFGWTAMRKTFIHIGISKLLMSAA